MGTETFSTSLGNSGAAASPSPLLAALPTRRFTVDEYERMARLGVLKEGERVELIEGVIVPMAAKGSYHSVSVTNTADTCRDIFGKGAVVREEKPIRLAESEPEPDVLVAKGRSRDYAARHPAPADVLLLIEVAETSLDYDRDVKGPVYAAAQIADYWIVDLGDWCLHVYRDPVPATAESSAFYRVHLVFRRGESVEALARPNARIAVTDLLP